MTHALKTWPEYFKLQESGEKTFELRKDDRDYKVGDKFLSQEFDATTSKYTGKETMYTISYILRDSEFSGVKKGYCILQLKAIEYI